MKTRDEKIDSLRSHLKFTRILYGLLLLCFIALFASSIANSYDMKTFAYYGLILSTFYVTLLIITAIIKKRIKQEEKS